MKDVFTYRDLVLLARDLFGERMTEQVSYRDDQIMVANLYGALAFAGHLDPATGSFSAAILVGAGLKVNGGSQGKFVSAGDRESVLGVLRAVDESCRLRLPEDYLAIFDVAFDWDMKFYGPRKDGPPLPDMPYAEFYGLAVDFFGPRLSIPTNDEAGRSMTGVLYDSFLFWCGYDEQKPMFGASIRLSPQSGIGSFLGRSPSWSSDRDSIVESFQLIDEYCRLRLPEKFLSVFDVAHGLSRPVLEG
ncbi:hypothetical protein [Cryobacterium sp. PH31-O1]|uniref:hypothetical protein n=1 Tax=Cryobacterium sp. PH31-O1 TaxID=3046306 RepID=UPI0024BB5765|nr:hypothetical protein [Cryobacterium sp. PH31-O1]MDJ0338450.1 hypothetical protein [Cryobacterium sp. PH31-O1]